MSDPHPGNGTKSFKTQFERVIGRLFGYNKKETLETDIILTLTPRIVRVLNLTAEDLHPFRMGRDGGAPITDIAPLPIPLPQRPPGGDEAAAPRLSPTFPTSPAGTAAPVRAPVPVKPKG